MVKTENGFQTPAWVCDFMAASIHGHPNTILEPTPGNGNIIRSIEKYHPDATIIVPDGDFMTMAPQEVDIVIANPPFTPMAAGYEMLYRFFEFSGNVVALMPWLTVINSEKRLDILKSHGLRGIVHLPRRAFSGSRVQTCILTFTKGYKGVISFRDGKDLIHAGGNNGKTQ